MVASQLLRTKFYIPRPRPERVLRPRLVGQLNAGLERRLTLVSAPAGFGKTTLLSEWAAGYAGEVAWLSLDENDNDPVRFLAYLVSALQNIHESIGEGLLGLLASADVPPSQELLTALINQVHELSPADEPDVLVLDDYHSIHEDRIHDAILFLIDNLPPQLRLVISTRADPPLPFARLRGRGQLAELRQADLCFTPQEAVEFLNQVMGLDLSPGDTDALNRRTEGWIAGLQMAAISMRGMENAADFIQEFTGSNRYILDYLVEEVLERQPAHVQKFLQGTAILERMCASLCDAVLGWDDSFPGEDAWEGLSMPPGGAQAVLEHLERANLFVVPLDDHREWYRYHHLFAELLRRRLGQADPKDAVRLHCRASEWYERQGSYSEAIQHALAAGEYPHAASLIEREAEALLMRSEFATVEAWCRVVPEEVRRDHPALRVIYAIVTILRGRPLEEIERSLGEAYSDEAVDRYEDEIALCHAILANFQGDVQRSVEFSMQVLESLPEDRLFYRGLAARNLGTVYLLVGDVAAAGPIFEEDLRNSQRGNDKMGIITGLQRLAATRAVQGALHEAHDLNRRAVELGVDAKANRLPVAVKALAGLADVLREWNDLDAGEAYARESIQVADNWSPAYGLIGRLILARILQARGDTEGARRAIGEAVKLARDYDATELDDIVAAAFQARLLVMSGDQDAGERWAEACGLGRLIGDTAGKNVLEGTQHMHHVLELEGMALSRLCLLRGEPEKALRLLTSLRQAAERLGRGGSMIEILVLLARACHDLGDMDQALEFLGEALALGEPENYTRMFLDEGQPVAQLLYEATQRGLSPDYAGRLLAAFGEEREGDGPRTIDAGRRHEPAPLVEPLSAREVEVLQLIAEGLSNREIAQKMYLSLSTIKAHSYNIYSKLDVHSRTQAVARARALGILPHTTT